MNYNYKDHLPKRFRDCDFGNFEVDKENKEAFEACKRFCENFQSQENNLIVSGNVGTGKTHLAYSVYKFLKDRDQDVVITNLMSLLDEIKQSFKKGFDDLSIYQHSLKSKFLIIDEIGVQYNKESERIMLYDLFDRRYKELLPTIILSNLPNENARNKDKSIMGVLGLRIYDRIRSGAEYYFINGKSKR
jgi:DNA replication protein DnaC